MLEGDFGNSNEFVNVLVNDRFVAKCDPGYDYGGSNPSWIMCGEFSIPAEDSLKITLISPSTVGNYSEYHNSSSGDVIRYNVYGRVTMTCDDYFAVAPTCPK
jgi:hypothetical protein